MVLVLGGVLLWWGVGGEGWGCVGMGAYLSQPVTTKRLESGEDERFAYGVADMQGWRNGMEDAHLVRLDLGDAGHSGLFGVFDGHGGAEVAKLVSANLAQAVRGDAAFGTDVGGALSRAFVAMDELIMSRAGRRQLRQLQGEEMRAGGPGWGADDEDEDADYVDEEGDGGGDLEVNGLVGADGKLSVGFKELRATTRTAGKGGLGGGESPETLRAGEELRRAISSGGGGAGLEEDGELDDDDGEECVTQAGCTSVVACVRNGKLVVANAGDSRCVLCRAGEAVAMSEDHKPDDKAEYDRIVKAGGYVEDGRVNSSLNLSRAIGDMEYKLNKAITPAEQIVTAVPDVRVLDLKRDDEFLILACDGIWDCMTNQQCVNFVRERLRRGESPKDICAAVCDDCLAADSATSTGIGCDNMTMMVVLLKPASIV